MKKSLLVFLLAGFGSANATVVNVDAAANSSSGGSAAGNISLTAGQTYSITANPLDLWTAGDFPRWSDADGVNKTIYGLGVGVADANGDIPNMPTTFIIGSNIFPQYTQNGLTDYAGSLVGQIDNGNFFHVGTSYSFTPALAGTLKLYYLDSNSFDNSGSIDANVSAVPVPAAVWLMGSGLLGLLGLRKKQVLTA